MAATATALQLPAPFVWRGEHIAADLGHGATALFTTRRGGVSEPPFDTLNLGRWTDDDPAAVTVNRRRMAQLVGRPIVQGRQVHGTVVERVTRVADGAEPQDADGQATALPDVAALVLTADCLAIALAAPHAVAMVHAGWRGLAGGIVEEGVRAIRELGGAGPLTAAIGPAACGRCYEVGDEVRAAFGHAPTGGPAPIDLKAIARERLEAAGRGGAGAGQGGAGAAAGRGGARAGQGSDGAAGDDAGTGSGRVTVHDVGLCTMCAEPGLFFSHRRDRGRTGRQAGAVWRSSSAA